MNSLRWLAMLLLTTAAGVAAPEYSLDLQGPYGLFSRVQSDRLPTRVEIYVRGPRQYINNFDTPEILRLGAPSICLTNHTEISKLLKALIAEDDTQRVVNITKRRGYTYHLLLFDEDTKKVMQFRVFEPTELQTSWCIVDPRSDTGWGYFNDQIGTWLHAHAGIGKIKPVKN